MRANQLTTGVLLAAIFLFIGTPDVTAATEGSQEAAASAPASTAQSDQNQPPPRIAAPGQTEIPLKIHISAATRSGSAPARTFSEETNGRNKLQQLRLFKAAQQGKSEIDNCAGMSGTPPLPTPQDFKSYYDAFGANLDVSASFGDTGAGGIPSAQNSIQTESLGLIQFESEHFFYNYASCLDRKPTLSFGGTVGLVPALVMENLTSATATIAIPKNRPMFQDAFAWTLGPKLNVATSHLSQAAIFANLGEKYLISQVTSFKQGDDTITATPISNNVGQSALYWEAGAEWKYLNTDIANAYLNKTDVLAPPFSVALGYKQDSRFKGSGDLAGFSSPEARFFFRFAVGLNKIGNWTGDQVAPGKGYTFKFGIDYERPIADSRMPTASRYYVSANIDLMKIFKPSNP